MGQGPSVSDAVPYDANNWRKLSREYLASIGSSEQDLELRPLGYRSPETSHSRQSLDVNRFQRNYPSPALPRSHSYSNIASNSVRNTQPGRFRKLENSRSPSPYTHLDRFRRGSPSPQANRRTQTFIKPTPEQDQLIRELESRNRQREEAISPRRFGSEHVLYTDDYENVHSQPDSRNYNEEYQTSRFKTQTNGFAPQNNRQAARPVRHIPYRDYAGSTSRLPQSSSRMSLASAWSASDPRAIALRTKRPSSRSRNRRQVRKRIGIGKTFFIVLLIASIAATIWQVVFMWKAGKRIEYGFPIQGKLYSRSNSDLLLWQMLLVGLMLVSNLINIVAIWAALVERYWYLWTYVILSFIIATVGSASELLRGSYTAWCLPALCGLTALVLTHQIALSKY